MNLLIDTNVLLRLAQVASPEHGATKAAILKLADANLTLCIVPQVIYEFWVVATRPRDVNGLGMAIGAAVQSIEGIMEEFRLLKDERGIFNHWHDLVVSYEIKGKTAHDARLVGAMMRHGVKAILTSNKADFTRFDRIQAYTPSEVLSGLIPIQV